MTRRKFISGDDEVLRNLDRWADRTDSNIEELAERYAPIVERTAKREAGWRDRTGKARRGLKAFVEKGRGGLVRIVIQHSVPYGRPLETAHRRRPQSHQLRRPGPHAAQVRG